MRLIDADELTESIRKALGIKGMAKSFLLPAERTIIDQIDSAPTIGGWIKCTPDTMPETNDEVLTTYIVNGDKKRRFVESANYFYDGEEGHWSSVWDEYKLPGTRTEVLAWMPMPKPYKPPKEDKDDA